MARPPLPEKRDKTVCVRVRSSLFALMEADAAKENLTVSQLVRSVFVNRYQKR